MDNLQVLETKGIRVLTTKQIADAYQVAEKLVRRNFENNKDRYEEGKHYIWLTGEELKGFLQTQNLRLQNQSKVRHLYLWTEKGALLHAKSINTDKAWEVYDYLVDHYFRSEEIIRKVARDEFNRQQACENTNLVVNIPDNMQIQEAIREAQKYLIAVEVMLQEYSKYRSETEHQESCKQLKLLGMKFYNKLCDAVEIKPGLIKKVL